MIRPAVSLPSREAAGCRTQFAAVSGRGHDGKHRDIAGSPMAGGGTRTGSVSPRILPPRFSILHLRGTGASLPAPLDECPPNPPEIGMVSPESLSPESCPGVP